MFKMNKKGTIEGLQSLIVPLIGIGIVLVVGFLIFAESKDKILEIETSTTTYTKEVFTSWTSCTYQALTHSGGCMALSCSSVINNSPGANTIPTTMYNCSTQGLQLCNATTDAINQTVNVTYACQPKTSAWNATSDIQNATQDIPGWLPIIVITVIGAVLLGLVTQFRGRK